MTINSTPVVALSVSYDDDSNLQPVSAGGDPIESRIAGEMSATLQDWLHGLPGRLTRRRRGNDQTRNSRT